MSDGRLSLGVGAGERLNEHVVGMRWPPLPERHDMLSEAIDIMKTLWRGGVRTKVGRYFTVDHARLYDLPDAPIPLIVGVGGPKGARIAAEKADGIMLTAPKAKLAAEYRARAATPGPVYAEAMVAYAQTPEQGLETAHRMMRFSVFGWEVMTELPNVAGFEAVSRTVRPEDLASFIHTGPDPEGHVKAIRKYAERSCDHIALSCPGRDQAAFIDYFARVLRPGLADLAG